MHDHIMRNLRAAVKKLEEDELFEQTAVRSAALALEDPTPTSNDVDAIMQSLMGLSAKPEADESAARTAGNTTTARSETVTPQWGAPPPPPSHG